MRPLHFFKLWLALGCMLAFAVVYLSLSARPPVAVSFPFGDKVGHFLAYSVLMGWFVQLYQNRVVLILHAVVLILMGVGLEYLQGYRGRYFEYADMAANGAGVLLGLSLLVTPWHALLLRLERRMMARR